MIKYKKYKKVWRMKLAVIRKIITSDHFAILNFEKKDGMNGYVDLHTTPGFFKSQQDRLVNLGQDILSEQMALDLLEENVLTEAKQLINS